MRRDPRYDYDYDRGYRDYNHDYDDRDNYEYDRRRRAREREYSRRPPPRKSTRDERSGGGSILGIVIRILFIIFILAFFTMPQFEPYRNTFIDYLMAGLYKYQEVPDSVDFTVERVFSIESDDYIEYSLYIPIPQNLEIDGKEAQTLVSYDQSPRYSELGGERNNQWVWNNVLETGGKSEIKIIYTFHNAKISWDISIGKSGNIDDIRRLSPNYIDRYTGDAWPVANYLDTENIDSDNDGILDTRDIDDDNDRRPDKYRIEPSNPDIRNLLFDILYEADLIDSAYDNSNIGHLNVYKVVKAIYDHIDDTCKYPTQQEMYEDSKKYGGYPKWATGTYDDRRGDCDDQSILFISLCRAAGIPAMLEIGALYDPQMDRWEGHGWANVYIPYDEEARENKDYNFVMPMVDIVNDIFLFRDPNRFSEWVDDGVKGYFNDTWVWQPSHLEKRYLAWEYFYEGSSVDTGEEFHTIEFIAHPPEQKLYI